MAAAASPQRPSLSMELPLSPGAPIGGASRPVSAVSNRPATSRPASAARPATSSLLGAAAHAAAGFLMSLRPGARRPTHTGMEAPATPHTPAGGHGLGTAGVPELPGGPPAVPVMVLPSNRFKVGRGGLLGLPLQPSNVATCVMSACPGRVSTLRKEEKCSNRRTPFIQADCNTLFEHLYVAPVAPPARPALRA